MEGDGEFAAILKRLRAGESNVWETLQTSVADLIKKIHMPRFVSREEVVFETLAYLWQGLPRLRQDEKLGQYCLKIATRLVNEKKRRSLGHRPLADEPGLGLEAVAERNAEEGEFIDAVVADLDHQDLILFRLLYEAGLDVKEIAAAMGLDPQAVWKKTYLLRAHLRAAFCRHGGKPAAQRERERERP